MGLSPDTAAALQEAIADHPAEVDLRSVRCYDDNYVKNSKVNCKAHEETHNRRASVSNSSHAGSTPAAENPHSLASAFDETVADYISRGLSPAVAEAETREEIRYHERHTTKPYILPYAQEEPLQHETVSVPRIVVRRATLKGPTEDGITPSHIPANPEQLEVFNSAPAKPRAEGKTSPATTKPTTN